MVFFLGRRAETQPEQKALSASPLTNDDGSVEELKSHNLEVRGAGDARANGLYVRDGSQNGAARWRHQTRGWLCVLRDGSSWWIGAEKAAREDLYWRDAAAADGWKVCGCDDRAHRHFRGSAPVPELRWTAPDAEIPEPAALPCFAADECPVCLSEPVEPTRAPCGHVACALCLARAKAHAAHAGCVKCPMCRAPFALEGATHLATKLPLLEALPDVAREGAKPMAPARPRAHSNPLSATTRAAQARRPPRVGPTRQRSFTSGLRARLANLIGR